MNKILFFFYDVKNITVIAAYFSLCEKYHSLIRLDSAY